ncbi:serine/threonine protein kinase [Archaeoglobales archaeon]|nr:MAG: serine/threonine protein kinase [Archaeoglobales archaeon]
MRDLHNLYKKIRKVEWKVINTIFREMWNYKYVPSDLISKRVKLNEVDTLKTLKSLGAMGVVENKVVSYFGSSLTFQGITLFSLKRLVEKGKLDMLGKKMGEGKESVVYNCYSEKYGECVLKFHKLGVSFRKIREKRDYGDLHLSVLTVRSAGREYRALKKLFGVAKVPEPFGWEGNAVLMELVDGRELYKLRLENPSEVLDAIIEEMRRMFIAGVVHGDLSQYNVLIAEDIYIIDFPQWVEVGRSGDERDEDINVNTDVNANENWKELLERDVENILKYFKKAYGIEKDINSVINYVLAE